jgi:hypothetical protein
MARAVEMRKVKKNSQIVVSFTIPHFFTIVRPFSHINDSMR